MNTLLAPRRSVLILTLALAAAPYFVNLGASSLWDSNEAFYAETPREMIEAGDYINPSFNYRPRFNKPPFSYWVVGASYKALGTSEKAERLPIALGAMVLIGAAFALGRAAYTAEAGLLAAICMAVAPRFLMFSRRIIIDVYLAMFMSLTLVFFILAEKYPGRRRLLLTLMYVSVGLGVMTKGPVAALLPAITFLIYLAASRGLSRVREMMLPLGALIIAVIVLPWYVAIYSQHGWSYIETFLLEDNFSRYTEPVWGPPRGPLFYLPVILGDMFPWSIFLLPAIWLGLGLRRRARITGPSAAPGDNRPLGTLLFIWMAVIVTFFSISRNKEDLYILPIFPAAAALVGGLLASVVETARDKELRWLTGWTTAALAIILSITGAVILYSFRDYYALAGAAAVGYTALAGGLIALSSVLLKRQFDAVMATALTAIALNWVLVLKTLPDFERYKPAAAASKLIAASAGPDAMVGYYRFASPSMTFYLRRQIFEYYRQEELVTALSSGKQVYCLMTDQDYEGMKGSLPVSTYVLASYPVFQVKLKRILDRTELPQVVLITNKTGAGSS